MAIPVSEINAQKSIESLSVCGIPAYSDAQYFCDHYNLEDTVYRALALVQNAFQNADNLNLQTENDPETGEEWLVIDFTLRGEISQLLKEHEIFTRKWAESEPRDKKGLVRIEFNIL